MNGNTDGCREGYQGIRCDQFLPKTDSILSDPNGPPLAPICPWLTSFVPSFPPNASCPSVRPHPFSPEYSSPSNSYPETKWCRPQMDWSLSSARDKKKFTNRADKCCQGPLAHCRLHRGKVSLDERGQIS
ncbi:Pro-neuregulin-3 membrane-bound isoform [Dissostichus eleginoides]|uniref:Pro-neuregulin-3 membrane-bound isoform n=1 Tax=Dissostichus eleginoides TaxID=100907 RepID=A0AAD9FJM1_DISEL|nr:Pro-neuregulin-3 membrane-bound isoform [Dissostichus eleginoides]